MCMCIVVGKREKSVVNLANTNGGGFAVCYVCGSPQKVWGWYVLGLT